MKEKENIVYKGKIFDLIQKDVVKGIVFCDR